MSVTLYIGNEAADLSKDTVIATTIQVHDLSNLDSRDGNYTNQFKLPLTGKNKRLLGYANDVNSVTDTPYKSILSMLIVDGISKAGFLHINGTSGDFADAVFYSGNTDYFELLGDKKLNDLDWSAYDTYWGIDSSKTPNVFTTKANTSGVRWPLVEYGTKEQYKTFPTDTRIVNPKTLRPGIYAIDMVAAISDSIGYQIDALLNGNLAAGVASEVIPIVTNNPKHTDAYNENLKFDAYKTANQTVTALSDIVTFPNVVNDPSSLFDDTYYTVDSSGKYDLRLIFKYVELTVSPPAWPKFVINKIDTEGNVTEISAFQTTGTDTNVFLTLESPNVDLLQGEQVYVKVFLIDDINVLTGSNFSIVNVIETNINYGNLFEFNGNLPDMLLKDFIKAICQRYNLIIITDAISKIIFFYPFQELYKAQPLDWSAKLNKEVGISFHPETFAQNNQLRWADETNNPPEYANGSFQIADETLKKELIVIQQPFGASLDVVRLQGLNVAQIPLLEFDEVSVSSGDAPAIATPNQVTIFNPTPLLQGLGFQGNVIYKLTTVKPRLVYVDSQVLTDGIIYDDGTFTESDNTTAEPLTHFKGQSYNLTFEDNENGLIEYYQELKFGLAKYKKVTAQFNLTAKDVFTFDFKRPISLGNMGNFYVNKIKEFRKGQLTTVELIKL